jgi:DNA-binding NtrC family response regulator
MSKVLRSAAAVAERDTTVLLLGETGTGKELLARIIHAASPRRKEPFVQLNCAGLPRDLTESELFGHELGAFTGAVERKIGLFEAAHGGTLFLDEVGEMDMAVQAKLLNVLEQKRFRRLGGVAEVEVDVRLIAATNRDLAKDVTEGRFREDLLYRLKVFPVDLPPLRARTEDILPLVRHFLREFCGAQMPTLSPAATKLLLAYPWPGNVRELRNVVERVTIMCPPDSEILPIHLGPLGVSSAAEARSDLNPSQPDGTQPASSTSLSLAMEQAERQFLRAALQSNNWNVSATARVLDISRDTLHRKIKEHNLIPLKSNASST